MPYTIEMCFDKKTDKKIREIWELVEKCNCNYMIDNNITPHITLTVFKEINHKLVSDKLHDFVKKIKPLEITLSHFGSFPYEPEQGVVFLAPTVTTNLLQLHNKFHDYFIDFQDKQVEYYLPNKWIPHCTIALNISKDKMIRIIEEILNKYKPIEARVESINYVKYHPPEILSQFNLK